MNPVFWFVVRYQIHITICILFFLFVSNNRKWVQSYNPKLPKRSAMLKRKERDTDKRKKKKKRGDMIKVERELNCGRERERRVRFQMPIDGRLLHAIESL